MRVQYLVLWGMFNIVGVILSTVGDAQYCKDIMIHVDGIISTVGQCQSLHITSTEVLIPMILKTFPMVLKTSPLVLKISPR